MLAICNAVTTPEYAESAETNMPRLGATTRRFQ